MTLTRDAIPGETLKAARQAAGIGQEELARRVGVTKSTVGRWEFGLRALSPEMWERVQAALLTAPLRLESLPVSEVTASLDSLLGPL